MLDSIRSQLAAELGKKETLSPQTKRMVSLIMGAPVDATNSSDFIAGTQMSYGAGPEQQKRAAQAEADAKPEPAAGKITLASRMSSSITGEDEDA
jgi:hypothetical protein